jgi:predicted glycosyltransferase
LVHGDPDFITFDKTFPRALELADMLHYTGYVVERQRHASSNETKGKGEVIVSSGSGAVGELLLRSAQRIRPYTYLSDVNWRLLAGHYMDEKVFKSIHDAAVEGVIVERARPDFINLLKNCRLSISQGGYNTVMEVLATGANGIAIPYAGGQETEQTLRVKLMEERGLIRQIPEARLSDKILIDTVNNTQIQKPSKNNRINLDGAIASANLVASWAKELKEPYT